MLLIKSKKLLRLLFIGLSGIVFVLLALLAKNNYQLFKIEMGGFDYNKIIYLVVGLSTYVLLMHLSLSLEKQMDDKK